MPQCAQIHVELEGQDLQAQGLCKDKKNKTKKTELQVQASLSRYGVIQMDSDIDKYRSKFLLITADSYVRCSK